MERNSANTYVAIAIATTMSYVCIEPIHDDKDAVAIAIHFVRTDQQRNRCRCRHSVNDPLEEFGEKIKWEKYRRFVRLKEKTRDFYIKEK